MLSPEKCGCGTELACLIPLTHPVILSPSTVPALPALLEHPPPSPALHLPAVCRAALWETPKFFPTPPSLCLPPSSLRKSQLRGATRRAGGQEVRAAAAAAAAAFSPMPTSTGEGAELLGSLAISRELCGVCAAGWLSETATQIYLLKVSVLLSAAACDGGQGLPRRERERLPACFFFSLLTNNDVFNPKQQGAVSSPLPRTILLLPEGQAARGGGISAKAEPAGLRVPAAASKRCARLASPRPGSLLPASGEAAAPGWRLGT